MARTQVHQSQLADASKLNPYEEEGQQESWSTAMGQLAEQIKRLRLTKLECFIGKTFVRQMKATSP